MKQIKIRLDLQSTIKNPVIWLRMGDTKTTVINFEVTNAGQVCSLNGYTPYIECVSPSGLSIIRESAGFDAGFLDEGKLSYTVSDSLTLEKGKITQAYLAFEKRDSEGNIIERLTTREFRLSILRDATGRLYCPKDSIQDILELKIYLKGLQEEFQDNLQDSLAQLNTDVSLSQNELNDFFTKETENLQSMIQEIKSALQEVVNQVNEFDPQFETAIADWENKFTEALSSWEKEFENWLQQSSVDFSEVQKMVTGQNSTIQSMRETIQETVEKVDAMASPAEPYVTRTYSSFFRSMTLTVPEISNYDQTLFIYLYVGTDNPQNIRTILVNNSGNQYHFSNNYNFTQEEWVYLMLTPDGEACIISRWAIMQSDAYLTFGNEALPPLVNSFENSNLYTNCALTCEKTANLVFLSGIITKGINGSSQIGEIPEGYEVLKTLYVPVVVQKEDGTNYPATVILKSDQTIHLIDPDYVATSHIKMYTSYISL